MLENKLELERKFGVDVVPAPRPIPSPASGGEAQGVPAVAPSIVEGAKADERR
jgi:hypothetical protein